MRALRALRSSYVTGERRQLLLELAAEDRVRAERTQPLGVQRCVQTVRANARRRVQRARVSDDRRSQPRRGVHRQMERDEVGGYEYLVSQTLLRRVDARDRPPRSVQPRRCRCEPEGLAAHFVRADENRSHLVTFIVFFPSHGPRPALPTGRWTRPTLWML